MKKIEINMGQRTATGADRSATTTLYGWLCESKGLGRHVQVRPNRIKEIEQIDGN